MLKIVQVSLSDVFFLQTSWDEFGFIESDLPDVRVSILCWTYPKRIKTGHPNR